MADFFSPRGAQPGDSCSLAARFNNLLDCAAPILQMRSRLAPEVSEPPGQSRTTYRTIWVSDLHLGTVACQAQALLEFLRHHQSEKLYLVGDIVDGWNPGHSRYFDAAQQAVIAELRAWPDRGTQVEFLPGNHDEASLDLVEELLGLTAHRSELIHRTAEGRRMLVTHGHRFDGTLTAGNWLAGRQAYSIALRIHQWYGRAWMQRSERPHALSSYLRLRVKQVLEYLTDFDDRAVFEAVREQRADGLICGHIHRAEQRLIGPIWYINEGDWVHNCTALVEDYGGALRLMRWGHPSLLPGTSDVGSTTRQNEPAPSAPFASAV